MRERARLRIRVEGIVQGVGFRPFVHALASRHGLGGFVGNDPEGVFIEVEGSPDRLRRFLEGLEREAPPLAVIERVTVAEAPTRGETGFRITESQVRGERQTLVSPDTATCEDCLREILDPGDRRFRYPFTNCTNCGPRFTIIRDVPYDRPRTTMAAFPMCEACAREYHDPRDRRFHAQPICCPACGPRLSLLDADRRPLAGDPIQRTAELLREGRVVAVKGLGGYHLAALAAHGGAVGVLRARKYREDKPFALMAPDLEAARRLCVVDGAAERVLTGPRRPIVLLPRLRDADVAPSVAPGNRDLGIMLPYTPLHHLLARDLGEPFVLTSGNVSDEPIAYLDDEAFERLREIADAFLTHDRPIHMRTDDSVVRVFRGRELPIRRSRGYVPQPIGLPWPFPRHVLACGAELKNTFCLARGRYAFVSHHIGDLENAETLRSFVEGIEHFRRLFDVRPEVVAHDLHPEYLSTKFALELEDVELLGVQHHHAHVAACLADNGEEGPVIGVAFDGLGLGIDGAIWGGEVLVADLLSFERVAHFAEVPMPGGAAAIREPWRMALAYLDAACEEAPADLDVFRRNHDRWAEVLAVGRAGLNSPRTSSCGRLFDAVAAILGVRDRINYEGQAAIELEQLADPSEAGAYPLALRGGWPWVLDGPGLVAAVVEDVRAGADRRAVAGRFHNAVVDGIVAACDAVREATVLGTVALSGGVFQNVLLLRRTVARLEQDGFRVLVHGRVPPNDGGISLGQAVVAGARLREGRATAGLRGVLREDLPRWETAPPGLPDQGAARPRSGRSGAGI